MNTNSGTSISMAALITKAASKQTFYTIRFFVDRELVEDAFRAYGYFRWVDDMLDSPSGSRSEKLAFIYRQRALLEACYRGDTPNDLSIEERMLAEMVGNDSGRNPGLRSYLHNMMAVMEFDAHRCGRFISQAELFEYTRTLATAVTDAMYYFIGHNDPAPCHKGCYLSVTAAHITHMLRDTLEDAEIGYFNIPGEYLQAHGITPRDVDEGRYREWVFNRVQLAREYFREGSRYLSQVKNLRCRLAGYAYTARFQWVLHAIKRDNYHLRPEYPERRSLKAVLGMGWMALVAMLTPPYIVNKTQDMAVQPIQVEEP